MEAILKELQKRLSIDVAAAVGEVWEAAVVAALKGAEPAPPAPQLEEPQELGEEDLYTRERKERIAALNLTNTNN